MRKFIIIFLVSVAGLAVWAFIGLYYIFEIHCKGRLSDCYRSFTQQPTQRDPFLDHRWTLRQFAASSQAAAFSVVIENKAAVVFVDLASERARLIYDSEANYWHPYLSEDGNRIVLVRTSRDNSSEMLSCKIATWQCQVVLRSNDAIRSPIEVDPETILYASSPPFKSHDGRVRYLTFDLHLARRGQAATRLSFLEFRRMERLSLSRDAILFSGEPEWRTIRTVEDYSPPRRSHVYVLAFDRAAEKINIPQLPLVPVFAPTEQLGTSEFATIFPDGSAAVVVVGRAELRVMNLQRQITLRYQGIGDAVSPAVFAGKDVIFGELYFNRYAVKRLNLLQESSQEIAAFNHSQEALQSLEKIILTIEK